MLHFIIEDGKFAWMVLTFTPKISRPGSRVPQDVYLLDESLRANVAFGSSEAEIDDQRVETALRMAKCWEWIAERPEGIHTLMGEQGLNIAVSGGQKQRIGIARALYRNTELLVLDEITSALDANTEQEISQAVFELRHKRSILIIAHRLATLKHCDRIVFLREGRLVDCGNFEQLSKYPDFKQMLESSQITNYGS